MFFSALVRTELKPGRFAIRKEPFAANFTFTNPIQVPRLREVVDDGKKRPCDQAALFRVTAPRVHP